MDKLQERGLGDMVKELSRGVSTILKPKSCFQRLYDDALEREERQKRLREKYSELGQQATETRFTTLDQELEQAVQVEQAAQAEEAALQRSKEDAPARAPSAGGHGLCAALVAKLTTRRSEGEPGCRPQQLHGELAANADGKESDVRGWQQVHRREQLRRAGWLWCSHVIGAAATLPAHV
eukprot:CAMPEP_0171260208 /NCGR_PEP_ID=MMETSP0790-20130122/55335_1 /TAXON_ID=2925 /ORGANISM="Alexandrium catenella, Strain OF101" /LENGTH=179 /DNA_ID=CAMNT_0011728527 /DNA_START=60 /DNA_END=594 /DNA_ORIENTATION=-